jgi:probable HAF family extracellular repeat protein
MKDDILTKILKSVWTSNVYPRLRTVLSLVFYTLGLSLSVNAGTTNMTITTFNAPGAGTAAGQGTFANGMNASGAIVGFIRDANAARHGFMRAPDGTFTMFDDPNAGTCLTSCGAIGNGQGTRAYAINAAGQIVGFFTDNSARCHGFVRAPNGTFTQIDAPDAGTGPSPQGTFPSEFSPMGINPGGAITGFYVDANGVQHGFVRAPTGAITEFDPPGSILTNPNAIDETGEIAGFYFDANFVGHAFIRALDGTFTTVDAPGADMTGDGNGTFGVGLTPNGGVEGVYVDVNGALHGFVRSTLGAISTFDVPSAGTGPGQGTLPESNNTLGVIAGNYLDGSLANHGFLRAPNGTITPFDVPGTGTGAGQGTIPLDNNNPGAVAGQAIDGSNVTHGFLVQGL